MKRIFAILVSLTLVVSLAAGCSGGGSAPTSSGTASGEPSSNAPITVKALVTANESTPVAVVMSDLFKAITERSGGRLTFDVTYGASSVFAGEGELFDMVRNGSADIANMALTNFNSFAEEIDVTCWPYVFESAEHISNFFNGDKSTELVSKIEQGAGIKMITSAFMGIRNLTTKGVEVRTPADLKGVKIRCMDSSIYVNGMNAMGATAVPIAYSELYFSLQTGVANGQENQMSVIEESKLNEVQDTICKTQHLYAINAFIANDDFWATLPADLQELVQNTYKEFLMGYADTVQSIDDALEAKFVQQGMKVVDDVDRQAFIDKCSEVFLSTYGDKEDWVNLFNAIKEAA